MIKQWRIYPSAPTDFFENHPEYSQFTLQLLYNRNIKPQEEINQFFKLDFANLNDPFLFNQMGKAVSRLALAISKKEKIAIWGDYDVDGVSGSGLLYILLSQFISKDNINVYIPNRNKEGYGINQNGLKELAKWGTKVLITVDCGLSNFEEIKLANNLGIDVIICDHHLEPEVDPPALAILNPKSKKENYPFKYLSGTGVAFKLASAYLKLLSKDDLKNAGLVEGQEKWFLDLVAIATVADYMPIIGENRILVKYGLYVLSKTNKVGLRILLLRAGLLPQFVDDKIITTLTSQDLSFTIIPRINAMGRLAHASTSFEILTTTSEQEAEWLARTIENTNEERRRLSNKALEIIEKAIKPEEYFIFFILNEDFYVGIISALASRLAEIYQKPIFIGARRDNVIICSVRSANKFNVVDVLTELKDFLVVYGGHQQAGGFTINKDNLERFKLELAKIIENKVVNSDLSNVLDIDLRVKLSELNFKMFNEMKKFEPFGVSNWYPKFLTENLKIINLKFLGNGEKHLKIYLKSNDEESQVFESLAFNINNEYKSLKIGDVIDIVFELHLDRYNSQEKLSLKIIDFKKSN